MKTVVVFQSDAFDTAPRHDVSPLGHDVARWLMQRLQAAGVAVDGEPAQEDFGWYFDFTVERTAHCCVIGSRPREDDTFEWIGWVERSRGFLGSVLGFRNKVILPAAVRALHVALSNAPEISGIVWHDKSAFDRSDETQGSPTPE